MKDMWLENARNCSSTLWGWNFNEVPQQSWSFLGNKLEQSQLSSHKPPVALDNPGTGCESLSAPKLKTQQQKDPVSGNCFLSKQTSSRVWLVPSLSRTNTYHSQSTLGAFFHCPPWGLWQSGSTAKASASFPVAKQTGQCASFLVRAAALKKQSEHGTRRVKVAPAMEFLSFPNQSQTISSTVYLYTFNHSILHRSHSVLSTPLQQVPHLSSETQRTLAALTLPTESL